MCLFTHFNSIAKAATNHNKMIKLSAIFIWYIGKFDVATSKGLIDIEDNNDFVSDRKSDPELYNSIIKYFVNCFLKLLQPFFVFLFCQGKNR